MNSFTSNFFSLSFQHLDVGGWFIDQLTWKGRTIVHAGTHEFAAGWEVSIDDMRYTPHLEGILPEAIQQRGDETSPEWILPHRTADGLSQINQHLKIHNGALEIWVEVVNDSSEEQIITNLNFAQLKLDPTFLKGMEVWHHYAQTLAPVADNYFELHDPAVLLHQPLDDWGLAIINMAPAQTHRISTGPYTSIGYSNGAAPFAWHLASGETFQSDSCVTQPYEGDGQVALYDYIHSTLRHNNPLPQSLTYCSWEPFGRDIDEERILKQVDQAHDLGFETFVIDDGWQLHAGDWEPDLEKFPKGLQPIRDRLHDRGMDLGLWVSLATINGQAKSYQEFSDCIIRNANGEQRETHVFEGTLGIACLASRFAPYIEKRLHDLIEELDLRYLKLDLPVAYDVYHQPAILCHAPDHNHAPGRDYTLKSYRETQQMAKRLKAAFPKLIIDLTFELWGGWNAIDPALVTCADVCWLSNLNDATGSGSYGPAQARHLAASRSRIIPTEHLVVGNLRCNGSHPKESIASAFVAYPMLLGDLRELSDEERHDQRALFAWFKKERDRCDLTAHFASLLEIGHAFPSKQAYSGFLRTDPNGNGILGLFRNSSQADDACIPIDLPKTLPDSATLQLVNAQTQETFEMSVADLRAGLSITLNYPHDFKLFSLLQYFIPVSLMGS